MQTPRLVDGRDYYIDPNGIHVLTEGYLLARGTCCRSGCRHCPYGFRRDDQDTNDKPADQNLD
jgi:hypothetical protein